MQICKVVWRHSAFLSVKDVESIFSRRLAKLFGVIGRHWASNWKNDLFFLGVKRLTPISRPMTPTGQF
jgi:hypothetical protein